LDTTLNGRAQNGAAVDDDPLAAHARSLEQMLAPIEAHRAQLEAELADLVEQENRIGAAITALTSRRAPEPKSKPAKPKVAAQSTPPLKGVSQKTLDDVYAVIVRGSDQTAGEITELTGLSASIVMSAVASLRRDERIRVTGKRPDPNRSHPGGRAPATYSVMPS